MGALSYLLLTVGGIGSLVCFVVVLIQMFKREQTVLGIACIVLTLCSGIGSLIAFVYGWMKSTEWQLQNVMLAWTASIVLQLIGAGILVGIVLPESARQIQELQQKLEQQ